MWGGEVDWEVDLAQSVGKEVEMEMGMGKYGVAAENFKWHQGHPTVDFKLAKHQVYVHHAFIHWMLQRIIF